MIRRIAAIAFIYVASAVAWMILGSTIWSRTYTSENRGAASVGSTWGSTQTQKPPMVKRISKKTLPPSKKDELPRTVEVDIYRPLEASKINVAFDLAHRQKGLLWYSTYAARFSGAYRFRNDLDRQEDFLISLPYPSADGVYDGVEFIANGQRLAVTSANGRAEAWLTVPSEAEATVEIRYRGQGLNRWSYAASNGISQVENFELTMKTNFEDIDFPDNSLSPTTVREISGGRELTWKYANLITGYPIALVMPEKLQPGPLAGRISYFGPVSLFFFFFFLILVTTIHRIGLHPMHYFFLAAAFFAFHLLLAYLVDHISIHMAFAISAAVSIGLVASYLKVVTGPEFAFRRAAVAQVLYLVLFSYAFFFEGYTGLTVTIGSILTLAAAMQLTAKLNWDEYFSPVSKAAPAGTVIGSGS